MPESSSATPPHPPWSLSVKQPECAPHRCPKDCDAGAPARCARAQSGREQARQHAVMAG